jgi:hypothetical protein
MAGILQQQVHRLVDLLEKALRLCRFRLLFRLAIPQGRRRVRLQLKECRLGLSCPLRCERHYSSRSSPASFPLALRSGPFANLRSAASLKPLRREASAVLLSYSQASRWGITLARLIIISPPSPSSIKTVELAKELPRAMRPFESTFLTKLEDFIAENIPTFTGRGKWESGICLL